MVTFDTDGEAALYVNGEKVDSQVIAGEVDLVGACSGSDCESVSAFLISAITLQLIDYF